MSQVLAKYPFASLLLLDDVPAIVESWTGSVTDEEFKQLLLDKLSHYKRLSAGYKNLQWMTDFRGLSQITVETQKWADHEFHPQLYPAGVRKLAFIVPESLYVKLPEEKLTGHLDQKKQVKLNYFPSVEDASLWLQTPSV